MEKGWEGFEFGDHYDKMGIRSSSTAELIFNDVKVPKENLLGKEGEGFKIAMATLDGGRIGIASQALGIAQGAYENALEYSKERIQFGKPICQQQIVSFKLADMATKLRCARFLIYLSLIHIYVKYLIPVVSGLEEGVSLYRTVKEYELEVGFFCCGGVIVTDEFKEAVGESANGILSTDTWNPGFLENKGEKSLAVHQLYVDCLLYTSRCVSETD